jgi:hypothetical protein
MSLARRVISATTESVAACARSAWANGLKGLEFEAFRAPKVLWGVKFISEIGR